MISTFFRRDRLLLWGGMLLVGILLPRFSSSGLMISLLCQIGIMMIFALSYNVLLGQTGLLSFGHAIYYGAGAFATMHLLNAIGKEGSVVHVALLPLGGGVAALLLGILLGWVTTKKAGTTFAMISLGIGEMVAASSLMFPVVFGGEAGVSGNRVIDKIGLFGVTFGPQVQVYYLIVAWVFVAAMGMFALTQTPLGRMANAVRDNPERAEFVGYNTQWVRYIMLVLSGFFAGIAGGLTALTYEIVTAETLNAYTSGAVLLMTFVGGIGFFYGPMIGAILIVIMQILVGGITHAWQLYFGLLFLFMVLRAPGGFASLIAIQRRLYAAGLFGRVAPWYLVSGIPGALMLVGLIGLIEMTYAALSDEEGEGAIATIKLLGEDYALNTFGPWLAAAAVTLAGYALLQLANRRLFREWNGALATLQGDND
ncbi:MAG: branched-chain amino acid ABC transporter permease [Rhodospirillaceae bacterium]|nr:branched-chain amino acid ABC transporter permease [Rhodospirillaceae bacterium]